MTDRFRFVKGTGSTRTKNRWSVRAKAMALSLVRQGKTAPEAIAEVAREFDIDISETPSYTKNAGSHIGRFTTELTKAIGSTENRQHSDALEACREFGLEIEAVEATEESND